jgi:hypothetical protein
MKMAHRKYPEAYDFYQKLQFIYKCEKCKQLFPIWFVDDREWKSGKFGEKATICKECFETRVPHPHYFTAEEYMATELEFEPGMDRECFIEAVKCCREAIIELWDMPTENQAREVEGDDEESSKQFIQSG